MNLCKAIGLILGAILLSGCGNTSISRPDLTPPPGYPTAKLWFANHVPPHHVYFVGVGHRSNMIRYSEFVYKAFRLNIHHRIYNLPRGSSITLTLSSGPSRTLESITIDLPINKQLHIDPNNRS